MTALLVHPIGGPLVGSVPVPSDKSIGHRSILLGALGEGTTEVRRFSYGEDNVSTMRAFEAMGVRFEDDGAGTVKVHGAGLFGLKAPQAPLDCGNSGTTMRLLAGVLAAQPFQSVLVGDESLSRRPMARVAKPLRLRGAQIEGVFSQKKPGEITAPLTVGPLARGVLSEIEYALDVPSAQVKSALLLSGLYAEGATYVREPLVSRDHTERMLRALGAPLSSSGPIVQLEPGGWDRELPAFTIDVPGDLSAAAFLLVAASLVPGSDVTTRATGVNPTRTGILEVLRLMGARFEAEPRKDALGEPTADLRATFSELRSSLVAGEVVTRAIDEVPIVCALAARARGVTEIADAAELRVKESDRIAEMTKVLRAFGLKVEEREDGLLVEGEPERPLGAAVVHSRGDHRIAMTAAVLGLVADAPTRIEDVDCIATSFPKFVGTLRALGARVEVV